MNILKILLSKAGKMTLSTAGAVGLSAAVGLGGIGAWQYLSSSDSKDDTSFTFSQPVEQEVVYVAGTAGVPFEGGQVQSSIRTTVSDDIRLMRRDAELEAAAKAAGPVQNGPAPEIEAYKMGGSEGLGTGQNEINEMLLKNQEMLASTNQQLAGLANLGQVAANAPGATGAPGTEGVKSGALASASKDWGKQPEGMATAGGNVFNSAYVTQTSGLPAGSKGGSGGASAGTGDGSSVLTRANQEINNLKEGISLRSKANFGSDGLTGPRGSEIMGGGSGSKEGRELELVRKRSAEIAANKDRAANEGARAFLASVKNSGGIQLTDEEFRSGEGASSTDMATSNNRLNNRLNKLDSSIDDVQTDEDKRRKDRDDILKWLYIAIPAAMAGMILVGWLASLAKAAVWPLNLVFWALAAVAFGVAMIPVGKLIASAVHYNKAYDGAPGWWAVVIGGVLTAGLGAAFLAPVSNWIVKKILPIFTKWFGLAAVPK